MSLRRFAFVVYDQPRPLGRARVNTKTGHFYTASKDQDARLFIRDAFLKMVEPNPFRNDGTFDPLRGPLRLTVTAWLPMPKSIAKKRREAALPTTRPDLDNYVKQVTDALNKYAFVDDAQIVTIEARKRYCLDTAVPHWEVILDEIES